MFSLRNHLLASAACAVLAAPGSGAAWAANVPGTPVIGVATPLNASAAIEFSAPASNGGAAITSFVAICSGGGALKAATGSSSPITITGLSNGALYGCHVRAVNAQGSGNYSRTAYVIPSTGVDTSAQKCGYSQSTYNSQVALTSTSSWSCSASAATRSLSANGIPDHAIGTFPNANNPNTISAQSIAVSMALVPAVTAASGNRSTIEGYALNGIKFDPGTAQTCTANCSNGGKDSTGAWHIEALNQTYFLLGTDFNNAHVQPNGAYHYHGMPVSLLTAANNSGQTMTMVGFANDGFPIYARYGYSKPMLAKSPIKVLAGSYRIKAVLDSGRPSTSIAAAGTFTEDYEYVPGLGDLDACNGRFGVTPEFPKGIYYYVITDTYPYAGRCLKGTATGGGPPPPPPPA